IRFSLSVLALKQPQESAVGIGQRVTRIDFNGLVVVGQGSFSIAFCQPRIAAIVVRRCDAGIKLDGSRKVAYRSGKVFVVRSRVASTQIRDRQIGTDLQSLVVMGDRLVQFLLLG